MTSLTTHPTCMSHKHSANKRRRTVLPAFGEASDSDQPSAQNSTPSAQVSTRLLPPDTMPTLTTMAARIFVTNLQRLTHEDAIWGITKRYLKILPDALVSKVFAMLRASCPALLSKEFVAAVCETIVH